MNGSTPECPACRVRMEEGYLLTGTRYHRRERMRWIEGQAEKGGLYGYRLRGRRQIPAVTWRCPRCGWLLWFAPDAAG